MSSSFCSDCCSVHEDDEQSLNPRGQRNVGTSVVKQPKAITYSTGSRIKESHENNELRNEIDRLTQQLEALQRTSKETKKSLQRELENRNIKINSLKKDVDSLQTENNNLRTRLSAAASTNLTDGNPNIADLSDMNRPTKLSDQFSELYDNEWTDAFETLNKEYNGKKTEQEVCALLLRVLNRIFTKCHDRATNDLIEMTKVLTSFHGTDLAPKELLKMLKNERKRNYSCMIKRLKQDIQSFLGDIITGQEATFLEMYIDKCTMICWLMAIQDPPVCIDDKVDTHGEDFETEKYKYYTTSGQVVDYVVWPVLYIHKDGNILSKGIAQGMSEDPGAVVQLKDISTHL